MPRTTEIAAVTGTLASPAREAPVAEKRPQQLTQHARARSDDYGWLRAGNWQDVFKDTSVLDADIRAYLEAENAYQDAAMAPVSALRETLIAEMRGRIKEDDSSVPAPDGAFEYGVAYAEGAEYPRYIRRPRGGKAGDETVIFDAEKEAAERSYFSLGGVDHSTDHKWLAWSADDKGSEFYSIALRDLATGEDQALRIEDTSGGVVWSAQSRGFYYTRLDSNHRPSRVYFHRLGTPQSAGCVTMRNLEILELFEDVRVGDFVWIE